MAFNGPGRELDPGTTDYLEESVYCVRCGTIYVPASPERDCPSCSLHDALEEIDENLAATIEDLGAVEDELDTLNGDVVDDLRTIHEKVDRLLQAKPAANRAEAGRR